VLQLGEGTVHGLFEVTGNRVNRPG
jgi:hypothetical protein